MLVGAVPGRSVTRRHSIERQSGRAGRALGQYPSDMPVCGAASGTMVYLIGPVGEAMAATMKIVINTPGLRIHHQHPRHPRLMGLSYSSGSKGRVKQQSSQQEFLAPEAPEVISSQVGSLARHAFVETRGIAFVATLDDRPEPQLRRHAQRGAVLKVNKTNGPHGAEPIFHPLQRCSGSFCCTTAPLRRRRDRPARFRRLVETGAELPAEQRVTCTW